MTDLSGVTAKLLRSREHISELACPGEDSAVHGGVNDAHQFPGLALTKRRDPIIEAAMGTIWVEPNADRTQLTFHVGKLPKIGTRVPTIIGDALFNRLSIFFRSISFGLRDSTSK